MLMESVENSKFGPAIPLELQTRLVDTWAENGIPQFYQILFLEYVKHLPTNEAEITIQEEIRSIRKGNSYIQLFLKTMRDKAKLEQFMAPATPVEPELIKLCEYLRKLRELNFKAAHYLYKIRSKYDQSEKNTSEKYFFHRFSIRLDQFRKALLKSKLSRVVTWQAEYDPFFMSLKAQGKATIDESNALQDLFNLPVDDSYRFLKMRKVLVGWIYLDATPRQDRNIQSPLEEKYLAFPQIKNGLMRERSLELQRLKQIPIQQDSVYKRSRSKADSEVDVRDKDANRTRYFWPRENMRQSTRNGNEPQLLGKSIHENHLSSIVNTAFQLPIRNERKSEDVGKIRRSRVAQLNSNILSRVSKPRYYPESTSTDKPPGYKVKLQRLNTLPTSPLKPNRHDANKMSQSPSRMLSKSLLINIMISPIRPPAARQPEKSEYRQPVEQMSSNISEKPPQPRRMAVESVDLGNYSPSNGASNYGNSGDRYPHQSVNNGLQNRQRQDAAYNQLTKRNASSSLDVPRDTRDNVRQTIVITRPQKKSNNDNISNNAQGNKPPENTQKVPKNDDRISTINQNSNLNSNQYAKKISNQQSYQSASQNTYQYSNQNPNQDTSISNYFPRKQVPKAEPLKQEPIPPKQAVPLTKNEAVQFSSTNSQNADQNMSSLPKTEASKTNQATVNQVEPQQKAPSSVQPSTNNANSNVNPAGNNTSVINQNISSIPPQNASDAGKSSNYPSNTNTNPQITTNINSNSTVSPNTKQGSNNASTIHNTNTNQNSNTNQDINTNLNSNQNPNKNTSKNSTSSLNPPPAEAKSSGIAASKQQKRQIKIKVGKLAYSELVEYVSAYSIHPQYSDDYDIQKILKQTELQQSYLIEFLINDQPGALALSSIVPINNYAIRLWLIHSSADPSLSPLLFRKYVQLVEKYITAPTMYFKGEDIAQLAETGFTLSKEKLYVRNRTSKPRQIQREFQQYFNCECSHVGFPQRQKEDVLFSQQIQKFDNRNSLSAESLFSMQGFSGPISNMVKVNRGLSNFVQVNKLLKEGDYDEYEANKSITASPIDLLRFGFGSPIKDPFTASEGVFKFYGMEFTTQPRLLCSVNLSKNNGKLYFGKNYQSIEQFSLSMKSDPGKRARFCVPMFTKNLYGRYQKFSKNQSGFYGNWEISLVFEDEMQGRVKHSTSNSASFTCPFFVGLEVEGSLLYCIQVSKDDLVY